MRSCARWKCAHAHWRDARRRQVGEGHGVSCAPMRRIIPVASGKGGVGKTTFAVNFALGLARSAPTVLVDLDTGTSSVRSVLNVPIERDLYHFKRQQVPLEQCITRLDEPHDPRREFRNFGFIASPKHFIEDLANPTPEFRRRLAQEINRL